LSLQTEHVLEISLVSHLITHDQFLEKVNMELGPNYETEGGFTALQTYTALGVELKKPENLVGEVPKWFNDLKGSFF